MTRTRSYVFTLLFLMVVLGATTAFSTVPIRIEVPDPSIGTGSASTSIAVTPAGKPCIAYVENGGTLKYAAYEHPYWVDEVIGTSGGYSQVSLDLDQQGRPVVSVSRVQGIWVYVNLGAGWDQVYHPAVPTWDSSVRFDGSGHLHVAYLQWSTGSPPTIMYATNRSGNWVAEAVAYYAETPSAGGRRVALDLNGAGQPGIAWRDEYGNLKYSWWASAGNWITEQASNRNAYHISLAISVGSVPHIAFFDGDDEDLVYANGQGSNWITTVLDPAGSVGFNTSISVDSHDLPHISYFDDETDNINYKYLSGGTWYGQIIESSGAVGWNTGIALDAYDNIHFSYQDQGEGQLHYAVSQDCNDNGVDDQADFAGGTLDDCDDNGIADDCEIAMGFTDDCNDNGVPDDCDEDCNNNGVPDECDIDDGTSEDCNGNGVPDECDPDCNDNGIPDECDIDDGTSSDCNGNNIPDECEEPFHGEPLFTEVGLSGGDPLIGVQWSTIDWGDYDDDGDLDLLLAGYVANDNYISKVYRNEGGWAFTDIGAGLAGVYFSSAEWGDYDGDGDLDILLTGDIGDDTPSSFVYRNDNGLFTDVEAGLAPLSRGTGTWGDFDNDGDLDILLMGGYNAGAAYIYRNDDGVFMDIAAELPAVMRASAEWGDYDNDGDLDILFVGNIYPEIFARIYRNDAGVFTDIEAGLQGLYSGDVAWGDYDSDGDLDILLSGAMGYPNPRFTIVYRNDSGVFTDIGAGLVGMEFSSIAWGDYDNDGDLDILIHGGHDGGITCRTVIYINSEGTFTDSGISLNSSYQGQVSWGDYDNDGDLDLFFTGGRIIYGDTIAVLYESSCAWPNTPPEPPANLLLVTDGDNHTFSWDPATDVDTPSDGLTYNLRVGTSPGAGDIMPGMSNEETGYRHIPRRGNANHNLSWTLDIPAGTPIYWGVQTVDGAFTGSAFASETVTAVNEADVAHFGFHVSATNPFERETTIRFTIPSRQTVTICIYSIAGRRVATLVDGQAFEQGAHSIGWEGRDDAGRAVAAGMYFYRVDAGEYTETKRMTLIR